MWTASSSSSSLDNSRKPGPPYPPEDAGLGGIPTNSVDTPISAVILALFIGSAVFYMTIFQRNRRRGHKFVLSGLLFGLSMARIAANVMRIVWAIYPRSTQIAIAATIFANTGVVLAIAQRILRAHHRKFSFYTLDPRKRSQLRDMQLFASASLAVLSFLPIPIVLASVLVPSKHPVGQLGTKGGMRTNAALVLLTSSILALGASFRASVAFQLRPASRLAWFDSKSLLLLLHIRRGARRRLPERAACQAQTATPEKGEACVT
ncbi:uncharacterized protein UV8b_06790 [Ustilaginoidea virens]|uniref:Uncharacterized protein n=1 Tax=Ustilaginoidea virens TaxID=1159556 RepID=A0A8E5HVT3_USTVR|nr:uncharacterized protein UV8b_06790 [Ustilaginoidea virens]QUC22549.1 hypothetical protein UV8b_06790 [Ustilaginoidea virens]